MVRCGYLPQFVCRRRSGPAPVAALVRSCRSSSNRPLSDAAASLALSLAGPRPLMVHGGASNRSLWPHIDHSHGWTVYGPLLSPRIDSRIGRIAPRILVRWLSADTSVPDGTWLPFDAPSPWRSVLASWHKKTGAGSVPHQTIIRFARAGDIE